MELIELFNYVLWGLNALFPFLFAYLYVLRYDLYIHIALCIVVQCLQLFMLIPPYLYLVFGYDHGTRRVVMGWLHKKIRERQRDRLEIVPTVALCQTSHLLPFILHLPKFYNNRHFCFLCHAKIVSFNMEILPNRMRPLWDWTPAKAWKLDCRHFENKTFPQKMRMQTSEALPVSECTVLSPSI